MIDPQVVAPTGAVTLDESLPLDDLAGARTLGNARIFLAALRDAGGTRATSAGNLNRKFVAAMVEAMTWPAGFMEDLHEFDKVVNEHDAFPLHVLLDLAGLVKRQKGNYTRRVVPSSAARALAAERGESPISMVVFMIAPRSAFAHQPGEYAATRSDI